MKPPYGYNLKRGVMTREDKKKTTTTTMQYTCNESEDVTENLPTYVTELNDFSYIKTSYVRFFITLMGIS